MYSISLENESATLAFARRVAKFLSGLDQPSLSIHLEGNLGMGKTTFARGLLQAMGHEGAVKSPTYTLVEEYELEARKIYHFDLYRLADPEELEFIGIRDFFEGGSTPTLCLIEWAERGQGMLPKPDFELTLEKCGQGRKATLSSIKEQQSTALNAFDFA